MGDVIWVKVSSPSMDTLPSTTVLRCSLTAKGSSLAENQEIESTGTCLPSDMTTRQLSKPCMLSVENSPLIPRYSLGNWWSRYYRYTQDQYVELMDKFREHDVPLSVAVVDMDWHLVDDDRVPHAGWTGYTWMTSVSKIPRSLGTTSTTAISKSHSTTTLTLEFTITKHHTRRWPNSWAMIPRTRPRSFLTSRTLSSWRLS